MDWRQVNHHQFSVKQAFLIELKKILEIKFVQTVVFVGFFSSKFRYFRMQGAMSVASMSSNEFVPKTTVDNRATTIVVTAPKHVYHMYDIR